jgi:uncharacterized repeat protein (TIGR01451 family)
VTAVSAGVATNVTGPVTSTNAPNGTSATDSVNIYAPVTAAKALAGAFAPGASTSLTLSVTNPATNPGAVTGIVLDDTFSPAGLNLLNTTFTFTPAACGTVTKISNAASTAGDNNVRLSVASLAAGATCQVSLNVTSNVAGSGTNTTNAPVATGPVATTGTPANAPVTVNALAAPIITKNILATDLAIGGTSVMTITVQNTNLVALTGVAFTDTYPAGITGIAATSSPATCTGTLTGNATSMTLTAGTIPASTSCVYTTTVTAVSAGVATNVTGPVTSTNAPNGTSATDSVNIYAPVTAAKAFGAASIVSGGTTTLSITLSNPAPNPAPLTGVQVNDTFPAGLTLANTTFVFNPAACGTVTKTTGAASAAGDNNVRLNVASLVSGGSCQATVNVTSSTTGPIVNTTAAPTATGPVAVTGTPANASLTVAPAISDMSPAITLPTVSSPGATVNGQIVCTNAGPNTAANATCTAAALDNLGAVIPVTVGACVPSAGSTAAAVLNGGTLTCTLSYTMPGTIGGSDTTPVSVVVTGRTGADNDSNGGTTAGGNNSTTAGGTTTIIDAVNDVDVKPSGSIGVTTNLATNDQFPTGSVFTLQSGSTCAAAAVSATGVATYNVPATGTCVVNYCVRYRHTYCYHRCAGFGTDENVNQHIHRRIKRELHINAE